MTAIPGGTVTFLFSDIEGSTELLQRLGPAYAEVLAAHHAIVRAALADHSGREVDTAGDGFFAAFHRATDAVAAAAAIQGALAAHAWPAGETVRVRMGLHTGEPVASGAGYTGLDVHRAARIMSAGWGGQVLLSSATGALVHGALPDGVALRALGSHRLKDLHEAEALFQLVIPGVPADFPPPRAAGAPPHNLPVPPTPMLGRSAEVAKALALIAGGTRLVTLTGPGGTGKTRLAVEIAGRLIVGDGGEAPAGGAWFVQLAPISDPALVPPAIADALGAKERAGRPVHEALVERIGDEPMLLVLDNFEQVLDAAGAVGELVAACPRLTVLATSRAPLRIRGERELPVPPLELPESAGADAEAVSQFAAVRLFIDRATAVRPDFVVDNRNAPAVAEICARLDGLPLAIELAAARVRLLPPEAMLARLSRPLQLLRGGARDLPDRHQTLRSTIAWSYDMLAPDQRRLFRLLGAFTGGSTLESAAALAPDEDPDEIAEGVLGLLDQSLLRQEVGPDGEPRFRMLETVREFAGDALEEEGEAGAVRAAHAEHFLALVLAAAPHLNGPEQAVWLDRLDAEQADVRTALGYLEEAGRIDDALRMGHALGRFWLIRGHLGEGYRRLLRLVELSANAERTAAWADVRSTAGIMAQEAGGADAKDVAVRLLRESVAACRETGNRRALATALGHLGFAIIDTPDRQEALPLIEEALALQREAGDHRGVAVALQDIALIAMTAARLEEADALLHESREERRLHGETRGIAFVQHRLAYNSLVRGRADEARRRAEEGLALLGGLGDAQVEAILSSDLALALLELDLPAEAVPHAERALSLWERTGNELGLSFARMILGGACHATGDRERGLGLLRESAAQAETSPTIWGAGLENTLLGDALLEVGDLDGAQASFEAACRLSAQLNVAHAQARPDLGLAAVAAARGDDSAVARHAERAAETMRRCGISATPRQIRVYGPAVAAALDGLPAPAGGDS